MIYYETGSTDTDLSESDLRNGMVTALKKLGEKSRVLVIPPITHACRRAPVS